MHCDQPVKAITAQLYLPESDEHRGAGTRFHATAARHSLPCKRIEFLPNTGYAFAVSKMRWHSVDVTVPLRHSILLTYRKT